ncbi:hypothetical protein QBC44DRAFT_77931 [Cladorrhinum sp. PSN332]|nr:hypothetical protein QBC44DRAFT_77931 [Cladorrhinum sp. PSN332]
MAPQKFASVRQRTSPRARLAPFRDDTSLVALRYEQTKQAEPPIPIPPPRNPRRAASYRPASTFSTSTSTPTSPTSIITPPLPPPREEHPLFRKQPSPRSESEEWKRDSVLAPTASSVTLRDEFAEDPIRQKLQDIIDEAPILTTAPHRPPAHDHPFSPRPLRVSIPRHRSAISTSENVLVSPVQPNSPRPQPVPSSIAFGTPTRSPSFTEKLFGIRSGGGSKKLKRKNMLGDNKDAGSPKSLKSPKLPKTSKSKSPQTPTTSANAGTEASPTSSDFTPINTTIPDDSLWDDLGNISFSKRGSIMFGGENDPFGMMKAMTTPTDNDAATTITTTTSTTIAATSTTASATAAPESADLQQHQSPTTPQSAPHAPQSSATNDITTPESANADNAEEATVTARKARSSSHGATTAVPSIRVLPVDVERESQKVRSLYESGEGLNWEDGGQHGVSFPERLAPTVEVPSEEEENVVSSPQSHPQGADRLTPLSVATITPRSASSFSPLRDSVVRREYERAGGIEDWEDVGSGDVDRYGFINPIQRPETRSGTPESRSTRFHSRKRNVLSKRPVTAYSSSPSGHIRPPSRKVSTRSLNTFSSEFSTISRRSTRSSIRSATNRLPHNRDRRWMDDAAEMLALQAGLTGITDDEKAGKATEAQKRKELERAEKWRKMATVVRKSGGSSATGAGAKDGPGQGKGMDYEFDTKNAKLIERTWKGIPDCWRAAAWYSFLATSAKAWKSTETDEVLIAEFLRLQQESSPDDVQIDLDVPRTVNGHIMFRRRYRGGQRLLFRVLHAISLYFPETGYVQGMAPLAATLLCYFDEERTFVMLVRLWRYRGLEYLYSPGFEKLMLALDDFEKRWLAGKDVANKLQELSIDATAYGTRWYLTLFNLSIPFPAQLRVWDVFMLLGESPPESAAETEQQKLQPHQSTTTEKGKGPAPATKPAIPKGLDILHAASAALMHALRDVLLDSDFENAMKALTAWIPVKDEDLLMKVTRAEWKQHNGGSSGSSHSHSHSTSLHFSRIMSRSDGTKA